MFTGTFGVISESKKTEISRPLQTYVSYVDTKQPASHDVWMNPTRSKAVFTVPKNIEIVNKPYPVVEACRCQPRIEPKESAKRFTSFPQGWNGA